MPANIVIHLEVPAGLIGRIEALAGRAGYHVPAIYAEQLLQGAVALLERPEGDVLRTIMATKKGPADA